jgi:arginine/lysine/ornithine decarboxylase
MLLLKGACELKKQIQTPLFDALKAYHKRNVIPFDVPGHKHGNGLKEFKDYFGNAMMELDVNSMPCLDNLCNPIGVIRQAEDLAAEAYGADSAFFLVNGTSAGVQTMILSVCKPGDKIILPRNCHKSATSALILSGAVPVYVQPHIHEGLGIAMGVKTYDIERAIIDNPDAKAVFIINPTYYGVVSDLKEIIRIAHQYNMLVLADEAHGAHFAFNDEMPYSAIKLGADMSAVSLHKTGGSMTQSSILLLNEERVSYSAVKTAINLNQTTSASYLLLSSLDVARKQLVLEGDTMLDEVMAMVRHARNRINLIPGLYAFGEELIGTPGVFDFDITKLGVNFRKVGLTGFEVYDLLHEEYNIQVELSDMYNILAVVSLGDSYDSVNALCDALEDLVSKYGKDQPLDLKTSIHVNPKVIISPREAYYGHKVTVALENAVGEISGESIMTYPPGIPLVTPGERISKELVAYIQWLKTEKCQLQGPTDPYVDEINVLG